MPPLLLAFSARHLLSLDIVVARLPTFQLAICYLSGYSGGPTTRLLKRYSSIIFEMQHLNQECMLAGQFYHLYNRGNNREPIFPKHYNYLYFLRKVKKHFLPHLSILAYCLMPNHFHFLIYTNEDFIAKAFSNDLRIMLSSYTRAINKQERRVGSLFQQNTKMKPIDNLDNTQCNKSSANYENYLFTCFHYIHQNPVKAGLVKYMEDYQMSSFRDYAGLQTNSICNIELARTLLALPISPEEFTQESYSVVV